MSRGSEARDLYTEKIPPPQISKERGKLEIIEESADGKRKIPEKVQKKVAKKVAACITAGIVGSTGTFVALGETGNLPEPVQEWYDKTAGPIRTVFGIEELDKVVSNKPEASFSGLEIEGLNYVWQNERWEYVDSNDNLVVGFWNEKEGKYEHAIDILKGEWKGLFVNQSLEQVRGKLKDGEKWTAERWVNGDFQVPIPFDIANGGVIEEVKASGNIIQGLGFGSVISVKDLPSGTTIFSPFPFDETGPSFGWSDDSANFNVDKDLILFSLIFRNTSQCLIPGNGFSDNPYNSSEYSGKEYPFVLGYPVLEVNDNDILPKMPKVSTNIINPFVKGDSQLLISANRQEGSLISFSLKNFLKDDKGRFIFIAPVPSEIEGMKSIIEEERSNIQSEAGKQALEENLEISSLIEKLQAAPMISGLEFDKKTGFYLVKEVNDYSLKKDAKAGIFKNGFLGLSPEIISFLQQQEPDLKIPLPFNPEEINDLKIAEEDGSYYFALIIRLPNETTIYSPINSLCFKGEGVRKWGSQKGSYQSLSFGSNEKNLFSITSKEIEYFPYEENVNIGDRLGKTKEDIFIEFENCGLLKINDNPVFVFPNE